MQVTDCVPVEQLQDLQKQAEEVGWGALPACFTNCMSLQFRRPAAEGQQGAERNARPAEGQATAGAPKIAGFFSPTNNGFGRYRSLLVENSELAQQARVHPAPPVASFLTGAKHAATWPADKCCNRAPS